MAIDNDKLRSIISASVDDGDEVQVIMERIGARGGDARKLISEAIEEYKNLVFERAEVEAS